MVRWDDEEDAVPPGPGRDVQPVTGAEGHLGQTGKASWGGVSEAGPARQSGSRSRWALVRGSAGQAPGRLAAVWGKAISPIAADGMGGRGREGAQGDEAGMGGQQLGKASPEQLDHGDRGWGGAAIDPGKSRHAGCLSQTGGAGCHEGAATPVLGFGRAPGLPRGEHPALRVGAFAHVHASAYLLLVLKIPQSQNPAKFQP